MIEGIVAAAVCGAAVGWFARGRYSMAVEGGGAPSGETAPLVRAFEHLNEGVLVVDGDGLVRAMNSAARRLLGWESKEGIELPASVVDVCGVELEAAVSAAPSGAALMPVEVQRGDLGQTFAVIVGPAGRARRFIVIEDLSEIASVDKRRRDFVANASHELQTPLAALLGMLELLEDAEGEYAENLLRRCQKKAESLSGLTRDLIGLARAQDDGWVPSTRPLRLKDICQGVMDDFGESAEAKGLDLSLDCVSGVEVIADPVTLTTILGNLVQNSISYTDEGGVIIRVLQREGLGAILEVEDTGSGISPDILPRVFERFFRGDPARSLDSGGSGLGLAIVRNLVGRMGGRIALSSTVGEGTTFRVELPFDPAHPLEGAGQALHGG